MISMFELHVWVSLRGSSQHRKMRCVLGLALLALATSRGIQLAPVEQKADRQLLPRLPRNPPLPQLPQLPRLRELQERVRKVIEAPRTVTQPLADSLQPTPMPTPEPTLKLRPKPTPALTLTPTLSG